MLEIVRSNLHRVDPEYPHKKYLLAVSGGIDSVVLSELFYQLKLQFEIAHCNFQLREEESDEDEKFVESLSESLRVPNHIKRFDVKKAMKENSGGLQGVARELRFNWFEELRQSKGHDYVVTAAHNNDQVETILINLLRGTGLSGLHGIQLISGRVLHPMIGIDKSEIEEFARENYLTYREDSSNQNTNYQRNKLRHKVIPILEEIKPELNTIFAENSKRFLAVEKIYRKEVERQRVACVVKKADRTLYNMYLVKSLENSSTYLYEFLKPFGFSFEVSQEIIKAYPGQSGKEFFSPDHRAVLDRDILIVVGREPYRFEPLSLQGESGAVNREITLSWKTVPKKSFKLNHSRDCAQLDFEKLKGPLIIRKWRDGDRFCPLGMKGSKKVSDFLIDEKVNLIDKERTLILTSDGRIAWVIGRRISDDFKIEDSTKKVIELSYSL